MDLVRGRTGRLSDPFGSAHYSVGVQGCARLIRLGGDEFCLSDVCDRGKTDWYTSSGWWDNTATSRRLYLAQLSCRNRGGESVVDMTLARKDWLSG